MSRRGAWRARAVDLLRSEDSEESVRPIDHAVPESEADSKIHALAPASSLRRLHLVHHHTTTTQHSSETLTRMAIKADPPPANAPPGPASSAGETESLLGHNQPRECAVQAGIAPRALQTDSTDWLAQNPDPDLAPLAPAQLRTKPRTRRPSTPLCPRPPAPARTWALPTTRPRPLRLRPSLPRAPRPVCLNPSGLSGRRWSKPTTARGGAF